MCPPTKNSFALSPQAFTYAPTQCPGHPAAMLRSPGIAVSCQPLPELECEFQSTGIKEVWLTEFSVRVTCKKSQAPSFIYFCLTLFQKRLEVSYKNTYNMIWKTDEEMG